MDLEIPSPVPKKYLPNEIVNIIETGGTKYSDFLTFCKSEWKQIPDNCFICLHPLDSNHCSNHVWPYLGHNGQVIPEDCYIITTPPCGHQFHAGCLHELTKQGARCNVCPVEGCWLKWYDAESDLIRAEILKTHLQRLRNGSFSTPAVFATSRCIRLDAGAFALSLALAAYALQGHEPSQESRDVLQAIIEFVKAIDGNVIDTCVLLSKIQGHTTGVIFEDSQKRAQAGILLAFVTGVLNWGTQHYLGTNQDKMISLSRTCMSQNSSRIYHWQNAPFQMR